MKAHSGIFAFSALLMLCCQGFAADAPLGAGQRMTQPTRAASPQPASQRSGIFYKARTSGNMWDTWLFHHQGRYFLYYLCGPGGRWDSFALATSADGVHWEEHGEILHKADDAVWMGTGSTWKSPRFEHDG